jgi:hypothetical protein
VASLSFEAAACLQSRIIRRWAAQHAVDITNGVCCCYLQAVVKPSSTQQLADAIKQFTGVAKQNGKPLKIRTSRT